MEVVLYLDQKRDPASEYGSRLDIHSFQPAKTFQYPWQKRPKRLSERSWLAFRLDFDAFFVRCGLFF
jgi:hypothetical protein